MYVTSLGEPNVADYSLGLHDGSWHDRRSRCHPVGIAVVVRQWSQGGPNIFVNMMSPHNATYRPTAAALHGRCSHTVDRGT